MKESFIIATVQRVGGGCEPIGSVMILVPELNS